MATKKSRSPSSEYALHPSIAYLQAILENLDEKTGRSLDAWIRVCRKDGPKDESKLRDWLKREHRLGANQAYLVAQRALGVISKETDPEEYLRSAPEYVAKMYSGKREALKPLHDELLKRARKLGEEVKVCPCQTIVPLYRNHVFAEVKPATNSRIDFGLALKGVEKTKKKPPTRLLATGGFEKGDRITHRFAITSLADIDSEVEAWLAIAYELDA